MAKPESESIMKAMLESIERRTMEKSGRVYEMYLDGKRYVRIPLLSLSQRSEILDDALSLGGSLLPSVPSLFGPLIEHKTVSGTPIYSSALVVNPYGIREFIEQSEDESERGIVLDMSRIVEEAVFRINLFRCFEFEQPESVWLMSSREKWEPSKEILQERIKTVQLEDLNIEAVDDALAALKHVTESEEDAVGLLLTFYHLGQPVRSTWSEDKVQHTINLCNLIAKSSVISGLVKIALKDRVHSAFEDGVEGYIEKRKLFLDIFGKMAEFTYSSPSFRLGELFRNLRSPHTIELEFPFINTGMRRFIRDLIGMDFYELRSTEVEGVHLADTAMGRFERLFFGDSISERDLKEFRRNMLMANEKDWQSVGRGILECEYDETEITQKGDVAIQIPEDVIRQIREVQSTDFFTRENLPDVLQVWKELYFEK